MKLIDGTDRPVFPSRAAVRRALEGATSTVGVVGDAELWIALDDNNAEVDVSSIDGSERFELEDIDAAIVAFLELAHAGQ